MNILEQANQIVHQDRQETYGHPADSFTRTAKLWSVILDTEVRPQQVGLCLMALKLSRQIHAYQDDNLVDIAGYAQTLAMVQEQLPEKKPLVYLASPYSHEDRSIREQRFETACQVSARLMERGWHVYSPVAHTHPLAEQGLPKGWDYWQEFDREMLSRCDELAVLMISCWPESRGVRAEMQYARELGKPVRYLDQFGFEVSPELVRVAEASEVG